MAKMKEKFNRLVKKAEEAFLFYGKKSLELKKKAQTLVNRVYYDVIELERKVW